MTRGIFHRRDIMSVEELSPEQIIYIANLMFICVLVFGIGMILRSFFMWRSAKIISFRIEEEVAKAIKKEINTPSLSEKIKTWRDKRKQKKDGEVL